MAHTGRRNPARWIVRIRDREQHVIAVYGGPTIGVHRRRVARWSSWRSIRFLPDAEQCLLHLVQARKLHPLSELAMFHRGKRVDETSLRVRLNRERDEAGRPPLSY